jgi:DNA-binding response OmpR family regulator
MITRAGDILRILIIEDNDGLGKLLKYTLEEAGYEIIAIAKAGDEGLKKAESEHPEIILLDVDLPKIGGFDVSRIIKGNPTKYGSPKVIIMTAKTTIGDMKEGFESGAVDYIKKPFEPEEIVLKLNAMIKKDETKELDTLIFHELTIEINNFIVFEYGKELKITKREYDCLIYILKNKNVLITREKIMNSVWKKQYEKGSDRVVDIFVSRLKAKTNVLKEHLHTLKGWGYVLKDEKIEEKIKDDFIDEVLEVELVEI